MERERVFALTMKSNGRGDRKDHRRFDAMFTRRDDDTKKRNSNRSGIEKEIGKEKSFHCAIELERGGSGLPMNCSSSGGLLLARAGVRGAERGDPKAAWVWTEGVKGCALEGCGSSCIKGE